MTTTTTINGTETEAWNIRLDHSSDLLFCCCNNFFREKTPLQVEELVSLANNVFHIRVPFNDNYVNKIIQHDWHAWISSFLQNGSLSEQQNEKKKYFNDVVKKLCPAASGGKKKVQMYGKNVDVVRAMFKTFCAYSVIRLVYQNEILPHSRPNQLENLADQLHKFTVNLTVAANIIPLERNESCLIDALSLLEETPTLYKAGGSGQGENRTIRKKIFFEVSKIPLKKRRRNTRNTANSIVGQRPILEFDNVPMSSSSSTTSNQNLFRKRILSVLIAEEVANAKRIKLCCHRPSPCLNSTTVVDIIPGMENWIPPSFNGCNVVPIAAATAAVAVDNDSEDELEEYNLWQEYNQLMETVDEHNFNPFFAFPDVPLSSRRDDELDWKDLSNFCDSQ